MMKAVRAHALYIHTYAHDTSHPCFARRIPDGRLEVPRTNTKPFSDIAGKFLIHYMHIHTQQPDIHKQPSAVKGR